MRLLRIFGRAFRYAFARAPPDEVLNPLGLTTFLADLQSTPLAGLLRQDKSFLRHQAHLKRVEEGL
jgi:hypothetical protein